MGLKFIGINLYYKRFMHLQKIKGKNEVHGGEFGSDINEVKVIVEGLSYQIVSLTAAKSIEPHVYNQFDHDSYTGQANAINVMRKQSNYNLFSNAYKHRWRDHPNFSLSHRF